MEAARSSACMERRPETVHFVFVWSVENEMREVKARSRAVERTQSTEANEGA